MSVDKEKSAVKGASKGAGKAFDKVLIMIGYAMIFFMPLITLIMAILQRGDSSKAEKSHWDNMLMIFIISFVACMSCFPLLFLTHTTPVNSMSGPAFFFWGLLMLGVCLWSTYRIVNGFVLAHRGKPYL